MKNSIKETLHQRLQLQAAEASELGLTKIASNIFVATSNQEVIQDNKFYAYSSEEFEKDLEAQLWAAALRVADFHGITKLDSVAVQKVVEKMAGELTSELCTASGHLAGIGENEPVLPGELKQVVAFEIEE